MATNSSVNLQIANLTVGFSVGGGTTKRTLTVNGAGNTTLTTQQSIVLTLPNRATDTVVGYGDYSAKGVILVGTGAGTFAALTVGTNGFVLEADSTQTSGVKWAAGAAASFDITSWVNVTTATQAMTDLTGYFANDVSAPVVFTLPTTAAQFDYIEIVGVSAQGWSIVENSGQSIVFGNVTTTATTGGLASTNGTDSVRLQCIVANLTWQVVYAVGNITYT